ncbi:MAG TPA: flippase [Candidatus Uhrbacteria bacterium]|nr:flippase [Candidatus Uhrbacteria bacterium]
MSLTAKVAHNTFIQFGGKIISTLFGVITIAIMTRYLGAIGFGQYSTIMAYLQLFGILIDLGLAVTVVRLIADPRHDQQKIINNVFSLRFFSALIFLGIAPLIVIFFPYDNLVKLGVALATLSFFAISLNQILIGLFQKELKMAGVTISEIAGRFVLLLGVIIFAFLDKGLLAIILAVVLGSLTNFLLNYIFAHKFVKIAFAFDWDIWKKIIQTTWPIAISIAFNLVYFKADTIILSLVRSQAEVGIYNAPYRVLEILTNFIYMFIGIIFPILTLNWAAKNFDKFKRIFQKTFDFLVILAVPMVFGTLFLAKDIMLLIAGPEFIESALVLKIIIFATAIIFINALFGYSIVVVNKQRQMVWVYIFVAIVALIGYLIFIPRYGYIGAAAFTVVSEALIFLLNFIVTVKTTKFLPSFMIIIKTLAASLVMSGFLYFFQGQNAILLIIIAALIYALALYLFRGYSKEMILEILKFKSLARQEKINGS